jgi:hypothetical protein
MFSFSIRMMNRKGLICCVRLEKISMGCHLGLGIEITESVRGRITARACSWAPLSVNWVRDRSIEISNCSCQNPNPVFYFRSSRKRGRKKADAGAGADGDGSDGSRGGRGRRGDVLVGAVRLRARCLHSSRHVVPGGAGERRPLRAPRHHVPPLGAPLHLRSPLRCARRRQLQPHRLRRLLCRRTRQPLPLLGCAPLPGAGTQRWAFPPSSAPPVFSGINRILKQHLC